MQKKQNIAYYLMLALSLSFTLLAIITLLPNAAASKPNIMGYRSICPFAPAATALCCLLAGITCTLRNRFVSATAATNRRGPWIAPIGIVLIFGSIAIWGGFSYWRVVSSFNSQIATLKAQVKFDLRVPPMDGMRQAAAFDGDVAAKVQVKVAAATIIGVDLLEGRNIEDSVAQTLAKRIIDNQSLNVDLVAGATVSSEIFLQAAAKALQP